MTREDAIKILSILKAAYPNSYKGMTKDEANGTIGVWAAQFTSMPYEIVSIAINKLISTNTFPPTIHEVKEKIRGLYWEAWEMLNSHKQSLKGWKINDDDPNEEPVYTGRRLDEKTLAVVKKIVEVCEPFQTKHVIEPSLSELITGLNNYLTADKSDTLSLK